MDICTQAAPGRDTYYTQFALKRIEVSALIWLSLSIDTAIEYTIEA
ncbi:MAG: hypothetical protein KTR32_18735 [Granulosicoccus sp.]|nr:hypothetical protein [Granulosicoccus sp.]